LQRSKQKQQLMRESNAVKAQQRATLQAHKNQHIELQMKRFLAEEEREAKRNKDILKHLNDEAESKEQRRLESQTHRLRHAQERQARQQQNIEEEKKMQMLTKAVEDRRNLAIASRLEKRANAAKKYAEIVAEHRKIATTKNQAALWAHEQKINQLRDAKNDQERQQQALAKNREQALTRQDHEQRLRCKMHFQMQLANEKERGDNRRVELQQLAIAREEATRSKLEAKLKEKRRRQQLEVKRHQNISDREKRRNKRELDHLHQAFVSDNVHV